MKFYQTKRTMKSGRVDTRYFQKLENAKAHAEAKRKKGHEVSVSEVTSPDIIYVIKGSRAHLEDFS